MSLGVPLSPLITFGFPILAYTCHCCPDVPHATLALIMSPLDPQSCSLS